MQSGDLVFFRCTGLAAWLIRRWTKSAYAHVGVAYEVEPGIFLLIEASPWKGASIVAMPGYDAARSGGTIDWRALAPALDEPYSVSDAIRAGLGLPLRSRGYQCAELACLALGIDLDHPTPQDLLIWSEK